ncbi:hypothetical protein AJ79_02344 [Helicocarpus griseus UAMH5409]|uniref:Single-strand DNA deaminase toxin A-like C-terminal domain-containing protein n=1 Tax=Helicocarpus griseus UAMH5409 TaxID=1447875 RepID=A0A2B7Y3Z1_9EURO|nr:hypothetical protein AJ79_02344 [Helicocarpus griseus UAMH5409]
MEFLNHDFAAKARVAGAVDEKADRGEDDPNIESDSQESKLIDIGHGIEPFEKKTILDPISDCVLGKTAAVKRAAAEKSPSMAELLLEHGAKVNAVNRKGRSALMEAALWDRLENVQLLLKRGADKYLRDDEKFLAVNFAQPTLRNKDESYRRAGGILPYLEDTYRRDIDRQQIVRLLAGEDRKSNIVYGRPPTVSQCDAYLFKRSPQGNSVVLYGPVADYPVTTDTKTVARLERGGRVSGRLWTEVVYYISRVVGHALANSQVDQGRPGQFYACHAEKQLIAYFLEHHAFLPRDKVPNLTLETEIEKVKDCFCKELLFGEGRTLLSLRIEKKRLESADDPGDERDEDRVRALKLELESTQRKLQATSTGSKAQHIIALKHRLEDLGKQKDRHQALIDMSQAPPPVSLTEAVILVSSPVCDDCVEFKDKVNVHFGVSIQLFARC